MLNSLFHSLFGCGHSRTTFPITVSCAAVPNELPMRRTYVACLDCGEEIAYNWQKMQTEGRSDVRLLSLATVPPARTEPILARFLHTPARLIARSRQAHPNAT
jgi:hypothetical protein